MILNMAINNFIKAKRVSKVTQKTIDNYNETFSSFQGFCVSKDIVEVSEIDKNLIMDYILFLQEERGNEAGTVDFRLRILRTFFKYLKEEEIIKKNPMERIQFHAPKPNIVVFTPQQIECMLDHYASIKERINAWTAYRDYTLIMTFIHTGIRLGEAANLLWSKVNIETKEISVMGKLQHYTTAYMTDELQKELTEYKRICLRQFETLPEYVFCNKKGQRLGENAMKCIFKRLSDNMLKGKNTKEIFSNKPRISAHTFRHYYCSMMVQEKSAFVVQQLMRHSSIAVTQRYVHLWKNHLKDEVADFNPLKRRRG
jgi:integrase/recombinase XerD